MNATTSNLPSLELLRFRLAVGYWVMWLSFRIGYPIWFIRNRRRLCDCRPYRELLRESWAAFLGGARQAFVQAAVQHGYRVADVQTLAQKYLVHRRPQFLCWWSGHGEWAWEVDAARCICACGHALDFTD